MPKKKKQKEKIEPFITIEGVDKPCLSKEHLLEAELMNYKQSAIVEAIRARTFEAQKVENEAKLRIDALRREIAHLNDESSKLRDDNKRFWNKLGDLYKIDFSKVTYDSDTGIITFIEDNIKEKVERKKNKKNST
jgi:hypothetical protein